MELLRAALRKVKTLISWLVAAVLVLGCLEAGYAVLRFLIQRGQQNAAERIIHFSVFRDKPWTSAMFTEQAAVKMTYEPYLGWKSSPFAGTYVNVNNDGTRRTVAPSCDTVQGIDSVFVFGGSSVWGVCVRDEGTIPSLMAQKLCRAGLHFTVVNYGEKGYTFTQSLLHLALLLRSGHRPSHVLFLDGANDIASAHYAGKAGVSGLNGELAGLLEFKQSSHIRQILSVARDWFDHSSVIGKSLRWVASFLNNRRAANPDIKGYTIPELTTLSAHIAEDYQASYRDLAGLAQAYGFSWHCFLQPLVFTKQHLTDEELSADRVDSPEMSYLSVATYAALERDSPGNLSNLSAITDSASSTRFLDFCHVTEETNDMIAAAICAIAFPRTPATATLR